MRALRHLLYRRHLLAIAVLAVALLARCVVPTGYMAAAREGRLTVMLCPDQGPVPMAAMAERGAAMHAHHETRGDQSGHDGSGSCAFAGLGLAALGAVDPLLLAAAVLVVFRALVRRPRRAVVAAPRFLWPPRTGPPAHG